MLQIKSAVQILASMTNRETSTRSSLLPPSAANQNIKGGVAEDVSRRVIPFTRSSPSVFVTTEEPLSPTQANINNISHANKVRNRN